MEIVAIRHKLHCHFPGNFAPECPHCCASSTSPPAIENTENLLFSCPPKLEVWRHTHTFYLSPRLAHFACEEYLALLQFRLDIDRSSHELFPKLSVFQVFSCIQYAIWSAHYRHIFHHSPFNPSQITNSIHRELVHLNSQLSLETLI
ncbi:hypothetical protein HMPREF1544_03642 [Mucor circinelloides 1006PhL]|uniref:Reverse transcriptase zinc-binding domain-containing protein n=1 Tax=Mucor circinelloides f. circinelloides (strain 1006PhL) TaxID=1220926 RepID=S2K2T0_MUCC1|nr:hypothetical protein HMPREF1544_03642 [Mucor circinelloides 1006PhL]